MNLKSLVAAAAIAALPAALPFASQAAMINGQLDIGGTVNVASSTFLPGGNLDFEGDAFVVIATGDFDTYINKFDAVTVSDLTFTTPVDVYSVGGFTFTATQFFNYDDNPLPDNKRGFSARGILTGTASKPRPAC